MEVDPGDVGDAGEELEQPPTPARSMDEVISSDGELPPPLEPALEPFDMFAAQQQQQPEEGGAMAVDAAPSQCGAAPSSSADVAAAGPSAGPPAYRLVVGDEMGKRRFALNRERLDLAAGNSTKPLYLIAEWSAAAAGDFDRAPWDKPAVHASAEAAAAAAAAPPAPASRRDCVGAFLQPEQLDADDSWYCSRCRAHVQADKKLDLWRLPEVLVVHLKRFSYSRHSRDKIGTNVDFPLEGLDLRDHVPPPEQEAPPEAFAAAAPAPVPPVSAAGGAAPAAQRPPPAPLPPQQPPVYDLYAVSNHFGGLGGGHYTAFCRMPDDKLWYSFDDSSVREMPAGDVRSPAAYVLFYRRRGASDDDVPSIIAAASGAAAADADADGGAERGGFGGGRSAAPTLGLMEEGQEDTPVPLAPVLVDVAAALAEDEEDEVINMEGLA
jgi:hypothetical protein